jgi:chromate reductase, NAD(P)H dehydrogenase (quinone)
MERERIPLQLLLISGSLRAGSTNTALLLTAQAAVPEGVTATLYEGLADLPQFNPDDEGPALPPQADELRALIRQADAVLFSTPEYAGALPGSFKNALDWAVGDDQPGSMNGKPVAYVNVSPRGAALAHASLRSVLGYLGADIVEEACLANPVTREAVAEDGLIASAEIRAQVAEVLAELVAHAEAARGPTAVVAGR